MKASDELIDLKDQGLSKIFGFYQFSQKTTATGMPFKSFAGLYYYLITGKAHVELLKYANVDDYKSKPWVFEPDLDTIMYDTLVSHLSHFPLVKIKLKRTKGFIWTMDRELNGAEKRWLEYLNRYLNEQV